MIIIFHINCNCPSRHSQAVPSIKLYQVSVQPTLKFVCSLLEYHYQHNNKIVVKTEDEQQSAALNKGLWLISQKAFIPHAMKGHTLLEEQPIYITHTDECPNEASILVYLDGAVEQPVVDASPYCTLIYIFNQNDAGRCAKMQKLAQDYAKGGLLVEYRRQDEKGVWLKSVIDNG